MIEIGPYSAKSRCSVYGFTFESNNIILVTGVTKYSQKDSFLVYFVYVSGANANKSGSFEIKESTWDNYFAKTSETAYQNAKNAQRNYYINSGEYYKLRSDIRLENESAISIVRTDDVLRVVDINLSVTSTPKYRIKFEALTGDLEGKTFELKTDILEKSKSVFANISSDEAQAIIESRKTSKGKTPKKESKSNSKAVWGCVAALVLICLIAKKS